MDKINETFGLYGWVVLFGYNMMVRGVGVEVLDKCENFVQLSLITLVSFHLRATWVRVMLPLPCTYVCAHISF